MNMEAIVDFLSTQGADFALKLLGALVAWIVGRWIISLVLKAFGAAMAAGKKIDATLARLTSLSNDHFETNPDEINWGAVGTLTHYASLLRQITDSAFGEGEHAK